MTKGGGGHPKKPVGSGRRGPGGGGGERHGMKGGIIRFGDAVSGAPEWISS
jgi:hypothetical protein